MTVTLVIQARMGSSRFPGKVLEPLGGIPLLALLLDRVAPAAVDRIVVATSTLARDDAVVAVALDHGATVVRGSEDDVLARFGLALDEAPADVVVRLTADCPLVDPRIVDAAIARHAATGADYTSNTLIRTYPDGLDVEVLRADALRDAIGEAADPVEREHVTPFVYRRPERFRLAALRTPELLGHERWTVDTPEDLERLRRDLTDEVLVRSARWEALRAVIVPTPVSADTVALRPATAADADSLFDWRNDAETVRYSRTRRGVDRAEHIAWLGAVLDDPGRRTWVAVRGTEPVGVVRVDVLDGVGTVGVTVAPAHRGRGVSILMLRALDAALEADQQVRSLVAVIDAANTASCRAFGRVGFELPEATGGWITATRGRAPSAA